MFSKDSPEAPMDMLDHPLSAYPDPT